MTETRLRRPAWRNVCCKSQAVRDPAATQASPPEGASPAHRRRGSLPARAVCPLCEESDGASAGLPTAHTLRISKLKGTKRVFTFRGVVRSTALGARCTCGCVLYNTEYTDPDGLRHFYRDAPDRPYFQSSRKAAWERPLLLWLGELLERSQVAFDAFSTAYGGLLRAAALPGAAVHVGDLRSFDRRLAEGAWMQHELLVAQREAGLPFSAPPDVRWPKLQHTLDCVVPDLHAAFVTKWAVHHDAHCPRLGRCLCLTFDADAMTCRDVCQCRVGNELVLQGHGMVEIGCTATPAQGSAMCAHHTQRAALPHEQCQPCPAEHTEQGGAAEGAEEAHHETSASGESSESDEESEEGGDSAAEADGGGAKAAGGGADGSGSAEERRGGADGGSGTDDGGGADGSQVPPTHRGSNPGLPSR